MVLQSEVDEGAIPTGWGGKHARMACFSAGVTDLRGGCTMSLMLSVVLPV